MSLCCRMPMPKILNAKMARYTIRRKAAKAEIGPMTRNTPLSYVFCYIQRCTLVKSTSCQHDMSSYEQRSLATILYSMSGVEFT